MMVERMPYTGKFVAELNQATKKLNEISQGQKTVSQQELKDLIKVLNQLNEACKEGFWKEKKLAPEEMQDGIEKALVAIQLFHRHQPDKNKGAQKSVEQAIASLFSTLSAEINDFDRNLKTLKDHRIGVKVEKTGKSKQSE